MEDQQIVDHVPLLAASSTRRIVCHGAKREWSDRPGHVGRLIRDTPEATMLAFVCDSDNSCRVEQGRHAGDRVEISTSFGWLWSACWSALRDSSVTDEQRQALAYALKLQQEATEAMQRARQGLPEDSVTRTLHQLEKKPQ